MKVKRSKSLSPEPSGSRDYKRPKIEIEDSSEDLENQSSNILDFSDDVLLNIMKYLHPRDLLAFSFCCKRLDRVCRDRTLWRRVDCRNTTMAMEDLHKYVKFLQPSTTCVAIRGTLSSNLPLRREFLKSVNDRCTNLKEFVIEDCNINTLNIQISDFPSTIEKLSLKGSALQNLNAKRSYFSKINLHMLNLTCLILSHCTWVMPHSLMVFSKIQNLKELRLDSCQGLGECVAYASLATRFGFKTLETLDLRDTAVGDSEVSCFSSTKTLTHVYLECPSKLRNRLDDRQRRQQRMENLIARQVFEDPNMVQYIIENDDSQWDDVERCLISDRAVCALGQSVRERRVVAGPVRNIPPLFILEEDPDAFHDPSLKTLVVRNYSRVTDQSLVQLARTAGHLDYLDVTGTSVTKEAVLTFKTLRPNVKVISSFNEE